MASRRRGGSAAWALSAALALAGCGSAVRSTAVATPQPDMSAFVLNGERLSQLRAEAVRRCPKGFQVLRASESGERRGDPDDSAFRAWWLRQSALLLPPTQSAQMMVLCQAAPVGEPPADGPRPRPGRATDTPAAPADPGAQAGGEPAPDVPALAGIALPPPAKAPVAGYD